MITNEEATKVLDNYTSLKRRCSTIVCALVDNCPKVVEVTDLVKSPCGGGYISSDAQIWETEECLLVRYLCEYPVRQCSLDNWKNFYVPLRWVQSDKAAEAGIAEYKEKTADARAKWVVEHFVRQSQGIHIGRGNCKTVQQTVINSIKFGVPQPTGKWIVDTTTNLMKCKCCGALEKADRLLVDDMNFCYKCGADMRGEADND